MKSTRFITLIILFFFFNVFNGCGISAKIRAREDLEASKSAYKRCLEQHPNDPSNCASLKQAYETDLKVYRAISEGIRPGRTITINQE